MAEATDHLERGQIAILNELLELAVPLVEAPEIRIDLVVSAEIRIIESVLIDHRIRRCSLDDAGGERIGDRVLDGSHAARCVGHPAVVANGSTGVQYGVEDVPLLVTGWPVCSRVVAVTGQNVGRAATQRARAAAVGCGGTGWVKEKVTLCDCAEVARNVSVLSFTFIRETT